MSHSKESIHYKLLRPSSYPATMQCLLITTTVNHGKQQGWAAEWYLLASKHADPVALTHDMILVRNALIPPYEDEPSVVSDYALEQGELCLSNWIAENLSEGDRREMFVRESVFVPARVSLLIGLMQSKPWRENLLKVASTTHDQKLKNLLERLGEVRTQRL